MDKGDGIHLCVARLSGNRGGKLTDVGNGGWNTLIWATMAVNFQRMIVWPHSLTISVNRLKAK